MFFCSLFLYLYCMSAIIHIQLWAASIDGLRPSWQPAIIYTLLYLLLYISSLANKIVVVVEDKPYRKIMFNFFQNQGTGIHTSKSR